VYGAIALLVAPVGVFAGSKRARSWVLRRRV